MRGIVCLRWIRQRINNIKLQNKLASIYIVTGLIPLFVLFAFAFGQMRSILMDRDLKSMQGSLEQSVATVEGLKRLKVRLHLAMVDLEDLQHVSLIQ